MKQSSLTLGSIGAAILASLCCIGPLVAVALGLGSFGLATYLEEFRPILLGATVLLLAGAFYLAYRPSKAAPCCEDTCDPKPPVRHAKLFLWLATALVASFATFPYYSPWVWQSVAQSSSQNLPQPAAPGTVAAASAELQVEGMTCAGCAAGIQSALSELPGVRAASVSFERATATVQYDASQVTAEQLVQSVETAGFKARTKVNGFSHVREKE